MRLTFRLRFHTDPGQSLWLTGNHDIFGNGDFGRAVPLQYFDEEFWHTTLVFAGAAPDALITYNYVLRQPDGTLIYDWGTDKKVNPASFSHDALIIDSWNPAAFFENAFYTEPFKNVLLKPNELLFGQVPENAQATHTLKVKAPLLTRTQTLCLLGNSPELRNWNTADPLLLSRKPDEDFLTLNLDLSSQAFPIGYKYGVYDVESKSFVRYEDGPNRTLHDTVAARKQTIINDGFARLPSTTWKGAGVAIPVFSLRTEKSFGVGEFTDLKLLVDWCCMAGLKLIQILPVNDTTATHTWTDSYPYAAISAFALHPQYLNLERLAGGGNKHLLADLEAERKRLNGLEEIDYESVMAAKLGFLRKIYPSQKQETLKTKDFRQFFEQNREWLTPYAVFSCLRDEYGTADFTKWPGHQRYDAGKVKSDAAEFYFFLQYHLHIQLKEAAEYAHAQGIILKGDIPIGVYRHGADAWQTPELYHMDTQAGAPPDPFADKGQNWGFPTYNWPLMQESGFAWWKQRFGQMGAYFDAFRIDHILGFFRIWTIPLHAVEGILGYFVPALPVRAGEFTQRGIPFDRDRYVNPWITDDVLSAIFDADAEAVKEQFLDVAGPGKPATPNRYLLKPEFATQRRVENHFQTLEKTAENQQLKVGLFDLISNVLLFETEGLNDQQFHFRFAMDRTHSFKALDPLTRAKLKDIYVDYFFRRQDAFWMKQAMQKLPALKRVTNMLVCGEDLGLVPACVPEVMKQLGLLSLEIQRMPKELGREFSRPREAPYLSVVTPSTHDMSTIRGWWEEERKVTQKFYHQELGHKGEAPPTCEPWVVSEIIQQHLASPAMWSIFQLQDLLGLEEKLRRKNPGDERINVPANSKHYWKYRVHLTLENLLRQVTFSSALRAMLTENGRA
jgi:4-alpha-glucanotransferase